MAGVATFNNTMADIVYELDDREIYNDVRSQIDVTTTDTETIIDQLEERSDYVVARSVGYFIHPGESKQVTVDSIHGSVLSWLGVSVQATNVLVRGLSLSACQNLDGRFSDPGSGLSSYCYLNFDNQSWISASISSRGDTSCVVSVTNNAPYKVGPGDIILYVGYKYLSIPGASHEQSTVTTERLVVRACDDISVRKYARRVMNLVWPMGASQDQMQSIVNAYCSRYSEPVSRIDMLVQGKDDTNKVQILTRKISEKITVVNTLMGLNQDYWINKVDFQDIVADVPVVNWMLEEVRTAEANGIWILGTSELGNNTILAA